MNNNWFVIKDLDNFIDHSRKLVFLLYGDKDKQEDIPDVMIKLSDTDQQELDSILSFNESMRIITTIAKKEKHKVSKKIRYSINDSMYEEILKCLGDRMTSNILHSLVNKGIVETAYDSDLDDFVFWVKEENK